MRYQIPVRAFQNLAMIFLACFMLIAIGAGYWGVVRASELQARDLRRQIERELKLDRGRILATDNSVMAETVFDDEGLAQRVYPYPNLAPVLGYWTFRYGKGGLEAAYDDYLAGRRGQRGLDVFDELMHEPVIGADIVTTIRPALQVRADELLDELGGRGAIIVMEANTGRILALASRPTYDPNLYAEQAEALVVDEAQPTLNRATQGLYTPGSVFKILTLAGALNADLAPPEAAYPQQPYDAPGIFFVEGFPIREGSDRPYNNYPFDLYHALSYSSNVTFAQLALALGPDGMREMARTFGFGEEIPFDGLPTAASELGSDAFLLDRVGLANTGYGQGQLLVSPLEIALVTAAVANGGIMPQPQIVQQIRSRTGDTLADFPPRGWKRPMSEGVAAEVRQAMIVSGSEGFARAGAPEGIAVGGKTGTAQLGGDNEPHSWYTAFAPAEGPQIVVTVIVENAGAGGDVAAPIARELIRTALAP
ncbi:MAG: penicillin-binding protein 2 [Anaerolineales bacterium]|nr:penicillin-binding protein 2 [Anaerolineales bacterium]MCB9128614.1 penicillin-binding protein 2 [Ardenticatenales bacterium]MCB9172552.1 penicillin-binding protein 2 [Ardenticatenales bacterium]